jgi:hypothetical protein
MCGPEYDPVPSAPVFEPKPKAKRKSRAKAVVSKRRKAVKRKAV